MKRNGLVLLAIFVVLVGWPIQAANDTQRFADLVGPVTVGTVTSTSQVQVPYILWGGDYATFYANGGLTTTPGSIYGRLGLNIKLVPGDDTVAQARDYVAGRSPFFRGTYGMAAMASEVLNQTPNTMGAAELHMTFSQGDHLVCRPNIRTIGNLKGTKVTLQQGGPHVELHQAILMDAKIDWNSTEIVFTHDLTGTPDSPAEKFRKDASIDCAYVVTPDMIGLTGGLQSTGSGAEGTVKGAHVVVSTAERTRSIADLYFSRSDFARDHADWVSKFALGYLQAVEKIIDLKALYQTRGSEEYRKLLRLAMEIYGTNILPTEEDAHGLLSDCTFVGHPGNVAFFTETNNLHGFKSFSQAGIDLATRRGYATKASPFLTSTLDWNSPLFMNGLTKTKVAKAERFKAKEAQAEIEKFSDEGSLDDKTIYSFTIQFEPNQNEFSTAKYGADFKEVVRLADQYGGAVIAVRGHADPTQTLRDFVAAGMAKGILKRTGSKEQGYSYSFDGKALDLSSTDKLVSLINGGSFDGVDGSNPRETMQAALNLSRSRANEVKDAIIAFAKQQGFALDASQVQPQGVGIKEPFIAKPKNMDEALKNMRVEFRLIRVSAEVSKPSDFDF